MSAKIKPQSHLLKRTWKPHTVLCTTQGLPNAHLQVSRLKTPCLNRATSSLPANLRHPAQLARPPAILANLPLHMHEEVRAKHCVKCAHFQCLGGGSGALGNKSSRAMKLLAVAQGHITQDQAKQSEKGDRQPVTPRRRNHPHATHASVTDLCDQQPASWNSGL